MDEELIKDLLNLPYICPPSNPCCINYGQVSILLFSMKEKTKMG